MIDVENYLTRLRKSEKEIKILEDLIAQKRALLNKTSGSVIILDSSNKSTYLSDRINELLDWEKELLKLRKELDEIRKDLYLNFNKVEVNAERLVLIYRYILGQSNNEIAKNMHYSLRSINYIFKRAHINIAKILQQSCILKRT